MPITEAPQKPRHRALCTRVSNGGASESRGAGGGREHFHTPQPAVRASAGQRLLSAPAEHTPSFLTCNKSHSGQALARAVSTRVR